MKNQMRGIALILLGILFEIACTPAKSIIGYPGDNILCYLGIIVGVCGVALVFSKSSD